MGKKLSDADKKLRRDVMLIEAAKLDEQIHGETPKRMKDAWVNGVDATELAMLERKEKERIRELRAARSKLLRAAKAYECE